MMLEFLLARTGGGMAALAKDLRQEVVHRVHPGNNIKAMQILGRLGYVIGQEGDDSWSRVFSPEIEYKPKNGDVILANLLKQVWEAPVEIFEAAKIL